MSELTETETLQARIEIQKARIEDLEKQNRIYLQIMDRQSAIMKKMRRCTNCEFDMSLEPDKCKDCVKYSEWRLQE